MGDSLSISRKKGIFEKGFEQTYTYEIFYISEIKKTYPVTYGLIDYKKEPIEGSFYLEEVQLVDKSNNIYPIEKIINKRVKRGITEFLVKFLGYSNEANSWIPERELFDL